MPVDTLILHYTGMPSAAAALERLCDPAAKVSAHYLIDEDGSVVALVPEDARAWHAGVSAWLGHAGLNDRSIGIELVNPGPRMGLPGLPRAAVRGLHRALPGDRLPLADPAAPGARPQRRGAGAQGGSRRAVRLAAPGGRRHRPVAGRRRGRAASARERAGQLARFGYPVPQHGSIDHATELAIVAFQRHFRPERVDGVADRATLARLDGLLALL